MIKKVVLYVIFIFVLVGCADELDNESSNDSVETIKESEQSDTISREDVINLNDFKEVNVIALDESDDSEYKIPELKLENSGSIIFQPIHLKKSEKITLTFQIQSNNSRNHITIGAIKDFSPDSNLNYEIEKIYSESNENELTVTYTSPADANYSISILGTMADTVVVKNGKITK